MDHIGIDLHKRNSQICILSAGGELIEQRIQTSRERFTAVLGDRPRARILIEASTESEWAARSLEEIGHEVIVADPNFAPMYAQRTRKVKTDRRDARALAEACRLGAYRPAHRTSDAQQHVRAHVGVREALVQTRCKYVYLASALLRRQGLRWESGGPETFPARVGRLSLPEALQEEIAPLLTLVTILTTQIQDADRQLLRLVANDTRAQKLCTVPGVGPVTAATFVATIDRVERFAGAHQVEAYLGLVPRELSSGEKQCRGRITKAGNGRARWLLVEAAWSSSGTRSPRLGRCACGLSALPPDVASSGRPSPWLADSPASCTPCCETTRSISRRRSLPASHADLRPSQGAVSSRGYLSRFLLTGVVSASSPLVHKRAVSEMAPHTHRTQPCAGDHRIASESADRRMRNLAETGRTTAKGKTDARTLGVDTGRPLHRRGGSRSEPHPCRAPSGRDTRDHL